jgi:hypothetical protein
MSFQVFTNNDFLKIVKKVKPTVEYNFGKNKIIFEVEYKNVDGLEKTLVGVLVDFKRISGTKKVQIKGNIMNECITNEFMTVSKLIGMEDKNIMFFCDTERFY